MARSSNPRARMCGVCGRTLEDWYDGERVFYRHAVLDEPADHPPVAVRWEDMPGQHRLRCDFCWEEPVTHTLIVDKETGLPSVNVHWDKQWAMCQPCTDLVLADRWLDLRRRAFAKHQAEHGDLSERTKVEYRLALRDLKSSVVMIVQEPDTHVGNKG